MAFHKLALPERFEVVRRIGEGGMGVVYEAIDLERGEHVALKTIIHHDTDTIARVKREFRALQDIVHPNLVALRELVADSDDVFFTMELVEGVDLLTWVRGEAARRAPTTNPTAVDLRPSVTDVDTDRDVEPQQPTPMPESASRPRHALPRAFDEDRLRDSFRQIALGLAALHGAGKVHRDVKPSNVRVSADGRVVLLDFGLVFEVDARHLTDANVVGTPAYMAPEQVSSKTVGPEADWYAAGVMLYECLCGRRPFEGASAQVLLAKHYQNVVPPSAFVAEVPRDLEELCLALLQVEPAARPGGGDVLRRLRARASDRPTSLAAPFVGRGSELSALARALSDVSAGHPVVALLQGESGVGKSSIVRRFLDGIDAGRGNVMVLVGRCYERESVPYKALDEVVEALSRHLARMRKEESAEIVPPDLQSLAMVFPAMARVPALAARASVPDRDPLERRKAAFRSLRALLRRLGETRRLVLAIDDLQWTDADSLAVLNEILRGPDAPGLLLVGTVRTGTANAAELVLPGDVRVMQLGRLAAEDARQLAGILLARTAKAADADADAIASEAAGHPLFIDELVRHAAVAHEAAGDRVRLDEALWRRAQRLEPPARAVLDAACLLGVPAPQEVVANAAGIELSELAGIVALLHATNFVRTHGARVNDLIEPFHDRVREAVVARLGEETRRTWHGRIAAALELAKGSDPEVLATHWAGAGEPAKAAGYALIAAERAAQALAFDRAARLFEQALAMLPRSDPRRRAVREQLGDALARAGHCARAAEAYERAAEGAGTVEALDLRRRAADQLLRGAEIARGLEAARSVLEAVGLRTPRSTLGALALLLWLRLLLLLRGARFRPRDAQSVAKEALTRVDVCWSVSFTLPYADAIFAAISQARHVRLALAAGEPVRVARAVATEAAYQSSTGFHAWPKAERLLRIAHAAADRSGDPYARAVVQGFHGIAQCAAMRFEEATASLRGAIDAFRAQVPGSAFETTTIQFYLFVALAYGGRYGELRPMLEQAVSDAIERGDKYAAIMLRLGILNSTWLFAGDPGRARRELEEARRSLSTDRFRAVHYQALVAECYVDVYEGLDEIAYQRLHDTLPSIRRSLMLELQVYRSELAALRGRIAFALATRKRGPERERLVREGLATIKHVAVMPGPLGRVNERVMRANAAALRGDSVGALAIVEKMAADDASDAYLSRQAARLVLAEQRKDPAARALAERDLAERGGAATRGLVRLYLPAYEPQVS
ncbi:MAG TPA: AAA family ATPase [Polyangiaceae bacterium]